jgi:L-aspartate oxidase
VPHDRRSAEDRNLLDLARLTVGAALARSQSVGAHFRTDDPANDADAAASNPPMPPTADLEEAA